MTEWIFAEGVVKGIFEGFLISVIKDQIYDYVRKHFRKHGVRNKIFPFRGSFLKTDKNIEIEYIATVNAKVNSVDDSEFLRSFLRDAKLSLLPIDISKLNLSKEAIKGLKLYRWQTVDLAYIHDAYWLIEGCIERYKDMFIPPIPPLIFGITDFESFIEEVEKCEKEVEENLKNMGDLIHIVYYRIISITKSSVKESPELIDRLHWAMNKLRVKATIKVRDYDKTFTRIPENATVYDMENHRLIVVYDISTLKQLIDNL